MVYDLNGTTLSTGGGSGMLNVLDYGFKADGTTDNLAAFNALIAAHPAETLYFPKGVYAFSGKLVIDFCYMVLDNAELKCTAATKVNRFVEIRGKMTPIGHPRQDMFIRGNGKVNANFKADDCIAVARQKCTLIDHISIQNFQRYGICGKFEDASMETEGLVASNLSYELMVRNCLIETSLIYKYAVGIYDTGDSMYTDIVILNVKTALSCNGSSIFHNIHAWCYDFDHSGHDTQKALMEDTVFAYIRVNGPASRTATATPTREDSNSTTGGPLPISRTSDGILLPRPGPPTCQPMSSRPTRPGRRCTRSLARTSTVRA